MGQGKQAKVLRPRELQRLLDHVSHSRHPERDRVMVLLSFKGGLRALEIANLRWSMVTTATGELADAISLPNKASKGRNGGRTIPLHNDLRAALVSLKAVRGEKGAVPPSGRLQRARRRLQRERRCGLVPHPVPRNRDQGGVIAFGAANIHYGSRQKDHRSRRQSARHSGTRRPFVACDDATVHPGRYPGEAERHRVNLREPRRVPEPTPLVSPPRF